jgi:hypothetical protein
MNTALLLSSLVGAALGAFFGVGAWLTRRRLAGKLETEVVAARSLRLRIGVVAVGVLALGVRGAGHIGFGLLGFAVMGIALLLLLPAVDDVGGAPEARGLSED